MDVPFVDLKKDNANIYKNLQEVFLKTIHSSKYVGGSEVEKFENEFAQYLGVNYCIGVNSGTDALILGIRALELSPIDEIIVPTNTFIATALGASENGVKIVLVDCDKNDFGIDLDDLKKKITSRTKAIIAVHLYGQPDKIDEIYDVIKKSGKKIYLIEDAAQAHGAIYKKKRVGTYGIFSIFSFYPAKNLGALGDGGALVTNNKSLARKYRLLHEYGQIKKYYHESVGINSRLDSLQASFLSIKLKHLSDGNKLRQKNAQLYNKKLLDIPDIACPPFFPERKSIFHLYVIKAKNRNNLMSYLSKKGIATLIHYPIPLHMQKAYRHLSYKRSDFPNALQCASEIVSLPMFPSLSKKQIDYVTNSIYDFYNKG